MRSEEIRENEELKDGWTPKRNWSVRRNAFNRGRGEGRRDINRAKLVVLLIVTSPFGIMVVRFLNRVIQAWARNGLNVFEIVFLGVAFWLVFAFYRWLINLAR